MSVPATQRKLRAHHPIFDRIIKRCHALKPVSTAVAWPLSEVALRGADEAARAGIIDPCLIGPPDDIRSLGREQNVDILAYRVENADNYMESATIGVTLCHHRNMRSADEG